jgi:hypothetical protein
MDFTTDYDLQSDAMASYDTTYAKRRDSRAPEESEYTSCDERAALLGKQHAPSAITSTQVRIQHILKSGKDYLTAGTQTTPLPLQEPIRRAKSSSSIAGHVKSNIQSPPKREEWLMLCLDSKRVAPVVHQIQIHAIASNAELFRNLFREHRDRRERYNLWNMKIPPFWRRVKAIHFVRFRTVIPSLVMSVGIEDMCNQPHQVQGWICGKTRPIDKLIMADFLYHPDSVGTNGSVYDYIPRKLDTPLPLQDDLEGWALYFEERWSTSAKWACAGVVVTILYLIRGLVGIGEDGALGMAVAANNIGFFASIVNIVHTMI